MAFSLSHRRSNLGSETASTPTPKSCNKAAKSSDERSDGLSVGKGVELVDFVVLSFFAL